MSTMLTKGRCCIGAWADSAVKFSDPRIDSSLYGFKNPTSSVPDEGSETLLPMGDQAGDLSKRNAWVLETNAGCRGW